MAGGDEPRRLCCSVSPADQHELATVLVPDGCLALRCAFVASESHGGTRSAPLTFEPRRLRNARTFRGRRVTRADRGMVLCVSAAGTSRRGPSNGMGGSEGGWAQKGQTHRERGGLWRGGNSGGGRCFFSMVLVSLSLFSRAPKLCPREALMGGLWILHGLLRTRRARNAR